MRVRVRVRVRVTVTVTVTVRVSAPRWAHDATRGAVLQLKLDAVHEFRAAHHLVRVRSIDVAWNHARVRERRHSHGEGDEKPEEDADHQHSWRQVARHIGSHGDHP